jgi:putative ABC transport system permease protein
VAGVTLFLKRLRDDWAVSLGLVGLLLAVELVAASAPRLLEDSANRSLRSEIAAAGSAQRSIELVQQGRIDAAGTTGLAALDARGQALEAAFAPSVEALVSTRAVVAETPLWQVDAGTPKAFVTLRIEQGIESHITAVAGRLPSGTVGSGRYEGPAATATGSVPAFEAALSAEAAARMGIGVGDTLSISTRTNDPHSALHSVALVVTIAAIYKATDPADDYWIDDDAVLHSVTYEPTPVDDYVQAALLLSPASFPVLMSATDSAAVPMTYTWRNYVDAGRVDAGGLDDLVAGMRRLEATYPPEGSRVPLTGPSFLAGGAAPAQASLQSGLLALLETHSAKWQTAQTVLIVFAIGTGAVVAAMVWLAVMLASRRRRIAVTLSRRRGASLRRVLVNATVEALLLALPPAVFAAGLAAIALPNAAGPISLAATALIAGLGVAALVAAALGWGSSGGDGRAEDAVRDSAVAIGEARDQSRIRRLVIEGAIVAGAIVAAYLLRERALSAASTAGPAAAAGAVPMGTPDPMIAYVPALVGLAAAIVAVRLYPLCMGLAVRLAGRRSGIVTFLAVRHAARGPGAGVVVLVLVLTATVGTFAASVVATLDNAVDALAWQEVGAPYRVDSTIGPLNATLDPATWSGVEAVASASVSTVPLATGGFRLLETIDMQHYATVVAATPADPRIPFSMLGSSDEPLPAIVSNQTSGSFDELSRGDVFTVSLAQKEIRLQVVDVRSSFPGLPAGQPFIVVSRDQLAAASPDALPSITSFFVKAPDDAAAQLRAELGPRSVDTAIVARAELANDLRAAPIGAAVTAGIAASALIAILCAALSVAAALFLSASARAVETSHLRTLGLTGRQSAALIAAEFGPAVLVALAAGAGLGLGLFLYLRPGLGLATIVGSTLDTPPAVGLQQLVMLLAATAATTSAAVSIAAVSHRATSPAIAIRRGID